MKLAIRNKDKIELKLNGKDYTENIALIKSLPHFKFSALSNTWLAPIKRGIIQRLLDAKFSLELPLLNELTSFGEHLEIPIPSKFDFLWQEEEFAWQKEAFQFTMYHKHRAVIVADPGKGKTPFALKYTEWSGLFPVLIIAPNSVKYNWADKITEWCPDKTVAIMNDTQAFINYNTDYVVVNYDMLPYQMLKVKNSFLPSDPLKEFATLFNTVIIDETQNIKDETSISYHAVRTLTSCAMSVIGLSGTPIENRPSEFYNILNIVRPDLFNRRAWFYERYCNPKVKRFGNRRVLTFGKATNGEELHSILKNNVMLRVEKKSRTKRHVICVPIDTTLYKAYLKEFKQAVSAGKKSDSALAKFEWLRQKTYELKKESCILFIDKLARERGKVLVFTINKNIVKDLMDYYGERAVKIDGDIDSAGKLSVVKEFQKGKEILVANLKAGTGVDGIQKVCYTIVTLQFPWHNSGLVQMEGRCDRGGQKQSVVDHYMLVGDGSIDEDILKMIDKKVADVGVVMDGGVKPDKTMLMNLLKKYA